MVDPIAATGLGLSVVNLSQQALSKWFTRKDLAEDIQTQLDRIKSGYEDLKVLVPHMEQLLSGNVVSELKFRRLLRNVGVSNQNLNAWVPKIRNASPKDRVRRMKEILDQCENDLMRLLDFCDEKSNEPVEDICRRVNTVPVNPPRLLLEYNDPCTCEGKLKAAVLKVESGRVVGIVASGKGGVGKTCAIRGLAEDAEIKERFAGGTLYIQLGNDATMNDIISGLASIIHRTGGKKLSEKVKNCETLQGACSEAAHWFSDEACLFLIDDIWRTNGINSEVLTILASMVNSRSRLVYTSRDKHFLSRAHQVITFEGTEPDSEESRKMLLRHGGFSEIGELDDKNRTAFEKILVECKGLPLAFGIAGGAVHRLRRRQEEGRKQDAWSDVGEMELDPGKPIFLRGNAEQYGRLNRMVDVSLNVLESEYGAGKFKTMFRALCVLQKQQRAPVAMLQKLWGLNTLVETEKAAEVLDDVSVLQLRKHNGVLCVQLHDLVLDIARGQASDATASFYRTLLANYAPNGKDWWNIEEDGYLHDNLCRLMRCAGHGRDVLQLLSEPKWVVRRLLDGGINNFEQDLEEGKQCLLGGGNDSEQKAFFETVGRAARLGCSYFQRNKREIYFQLHGRLLLHATRNEETRKFKRRLEDCAPRPWVKASMGILQQAGSGALEVLPTRGEVRDVQYRGDAVSFISAADFSLGVVHYSAATGFSETVEFNCASFGIAKRAAFLPDKGFIVTAHEIHNEAKPKIVCWSEEAREMKQVVELKDNREITVPKRRRLGGRMSECPRRRDSERHAQDEGPQRGRLRYVKFCKQGTLLATVDQYHTIQMWDTESGAAVGEPLRVHTGQVTCVDVSADGTRILSGSWDGTVRLWDVESGAAVGEPLRGHTLGVSCVDVSADGTRILSGSWDGTVRLWDVESGAAVGEPLRGHTGGVTCMDVSVDGTRIVSGSLDQTVRLWDAESGAAVGEPLRGHTGEVICVDVSADGTRIVSGSEDCTVRLWDAESGAALGEPLRGVTASVTCVDVSADGTRIVSGSWDKTVRLWDAESGAAVGEPLRGHTGGVTCVKVSADGTRIVSGCEEGKACVWDMCSGKLEALLLHGRAIVDVALSADGSRVVSKDFADDCKLWDVRSKECILNSEEEGWQSATRTYNFSPRSYLGEPTKSVTTRLSDGSEVVLATCEKDVRHVHGTDVYTSEWFELCVIIR